ncbi:unknown [Prevotella sp. CAG:1031]|nr:unknown [Prevotella sp. CAG:1031]
MHLGLILSAHTENIDNLATRVFVVVVPFGYADNGLVACLASFEPVARNENVSCQKFTVGQQISEIFIDFQRADKHLVFLFENFDDFSLRLGSTATGGDRHTHTVAVEGVHRVALGHEDSLGILVGYNGVFAVAAAHENAGGLCCAVYVLIFSGSSLDDVAVESHLGQQQGYGALKLCRVGAKGV